ncbi:hypothetical protein EON83_27300 [bacterium]|nr:MAG: hypothetical protein EON83_27300 [bacterium]
MSDFPCFNSFRAVSLIQSASVSMPIMARRIAASLFLLLALCMGMCFAAGSAWAIPVPYSWGYGGSGQLGNGGSERAYVPTAVVTSGVLSGKSVTQVATGGFFSLALCSDGRVASWGYGNEGQLGTGSGHDQYVPALVNASGVLNGKTVTKIAAGGKHALALCSDGTLVSWGANSNGQLGNGTNTNSNVPVLVNTTGVLNGKIVTQIAGGDVFSVALCSDGSVVTWGYNFNGELGNGTNTNSNVPVLVNTTGVLNGKIVTQIAAGHRHALVLCSDGTLAAWGWNYYGQLGNDSIIDSSLPVAVVRNGVLNGKTVTQIVVGHYHCLALCSDGRIVSWGLGGLGQLGNNSTDGVVKTPVSVVTNGLLNGKFVTQIAAGYYHSVALCSDGTLASWGYNYDGELGTGNNTNTSVPTAVVTNGVLSGKTVIRLMAGSQSHHTLVIAPSSNTAPTVNSVSISPPNPTTNSLLTAAAAATDAEADPVTYAYVWKKNGNDIGGQTGSTLNLATAGNGDRGDSITVTVTANDGTVDSSPVTSSAVIVGNTAPVVSSVSISPTNPTTNSVLTATPAATDGDGDALTYSYVWKKNGNIIGGATSDTLNLATAGYGDKGNQITVTVTANDGTVNSAAVTSAPATVVNSAPSVLSINFDTTNYKTNDVIVFSWGAYDADGDTLTYSYVWKKNGSVINGETGFVLDLSKAGNGNKGDVITVTITANDGTVSSAPLTSTNLNVVNSAPVVNGTPLTPSNPNTNSTLTAPLATDADGDTLTYSYVWKKNGVIIDGATDRTLNLATPGYGDNDDVITVTITANDGTVDSAAVTPASVTIGNTAPVVSGVAISPNAATTNSTLTATAAVTDGEGDSISFSYQWKKNGEEIDGATGDTLDLSVIGHGDKGDVITVTVVANDGTVNSAPFTSAPLTIGNTAPQMATVSISPTDPKTDTTLTASPAGNDVDSDTLTFTYQWKKNGSVIGGATGNTLNLATVGYGNKNDVITVEVKANDGTANSASLTSAGVTVANTAPVATGVTLAPTNPSTNGVLTATAVGEDIDGDTLTYSYIWTKNNVVIDGETGKTLDLSKTGNGDVGDVITVTITANDGTANSAPLTSAAVTVTEVVVTPGLVVSKVTINPSKPQTDSDVAAVVVASGPAGAKLSYFYQWKKNGVNLTGETGRTVDLGKIGNGDRGDQISVEVRASDGTSTTAPVASPAVSVVNAGPTVTSLSLSPSNPKTNTVLTTTATAVDPDGDATRFVYVWMKNGVKINGEEGATLDLGKTGNGDRGDQISVLIKARDYSAASAPLTSAALTIVNSEPVMTGLSIGPGNPTTNTVLTANATGTDGDGDATSFEYVWLKNGVEIAGETGATLDLSKDGNGDAGDEITVVAKIKDATSASAPMTSTPVTVGGAATPPAVTARRSSSPTPSNGSS